MEEILLLSDYKKDSFRLVSYIPNFKIKRTNSKWAQRNFNNS